jgi:hypothetical protein
MSQEYTFNQSLQLEPAAPQSHPARQPITLAVEVSSQTADSQHYIADGVKFASGFNFEDFQFDFTQPGLLGGRFRLSPRVFAQVEQAQRDDAF